MGSIPKSIYQSPIEVFIAHECSINGQLPISNDSKFSNLVFTTLSQNRLSGFMPSQFINYSATSINQTWFKLENVDDFVINSTTYEALLISPLLEYGLYLLGNRFEQSNEWFNIFSNSKLPQYVFSGERNAQNLYITNTVQFQQYIIIGFGFLLLFIMLLFRIMSWKFCRGKCKRWCNHVDVDHKSFNLGFFRQIRHALQMVGNWYVILTSSVLLGLYFSNSSYYSEGFPLSTFSFAYLETPSLLATISLVCIVLFTNFIVAIYALMQFYRYCKSKSIASETKKKKKKNQWK